MSEHSSITRKGFLSSLAAAAAFSGCTSSKVSLPGRGPKVANWWKGMLHSHTCWSDGSAFPEQAVEWYRSRGYNFYSMSDHNVFAADVDHWLTVSAKDGKKPSLTRLINIYDDKIGRVVKTVEGKPGEALALSYQMADDDLYVRARIESPTQKPKSNCPLHPKCRVAWTQPYCRG